jgi:hypothetical protein
MKKFPRKSGFALITVLALVTVLTLLLGALMGTNRTAFGMLRVTQAKDRIDRTVSSVFSYCRFRLEHDIRWGKQDFAGAEAITWGHLRLREVRGNGGPQQVLQGEDLANATRFQVTVCNNLRADGEVAVLKDVLQGERRDQVPLGFCRFRIDVEGEGHLEGAEVMVRNPGLVSGVFLANEGLAIEASEMEFFTRDPVKNQARSLGTTRLTGLRNFFEGQSIDPGRVLGQALSEGIVSRESPVIWSDQPTEFALAGETPRTRETFKARHSGLNFKDQRFIDNSQALFDIPDVSLDGLLEVAYADGSAKPVQQIPPGVYQFEQFSNRDASGTSHNVRVLTRRSTPPAGNSNPASGSIQEFWYIDENPDTSGKMSVADVAGRIGAPASAGSMQVGSYVSINGAGGRARADLLGRRLVLDEDYNFEVPGDFALIGSAPITGTNPTGDPDKRQVNPSLYFGKPGIIDQQGSWNVGAAASTTNSGESDEKGSLKAFGKLYIQGDINGSTTLAASDDITLEINRFYDPLGNDEVNFSVFSEKSVSILPPPILEDADDREIDEETGEVKDVVAGYDGEGNVIGVKNISENTLRFTGLIYAGENVTIDLQDTRTEPDERRNLFVEGAIVAKKGHLNISNANTLKLVYNPQFVDRLLPGLTQEGQRRIEVTGWLVTRPRPF